MRSFKYFNHLIRVRKGVVHPTHTVPKVPDTVDKADDIDLDQNEVADSNESLLPQEHRSDQKSDLKRKREEALDSEYPCVCEPGAHSRCTPPPYCIAKDRVLVLRSRELTYGRLIRYRIRKHTRYLAILFCPRDTEWLPPPRKLYLNDYENDGPYQKRDAEICIPLKKHEDCSEGEDRC